MFEALPLILFALVFILILFGYPVAFTLGGLAILIGVIIFDVDFTSFLCEFMEPWAILCCWQFLFLFTWASC